MKMLVIERCLDCLDCVKVFRKIDYRCAKTLKEIKPEKIPDWCPLADFDPETDCIIYGEAEVFGQGNLDASGAGEEAT